MGFVSKALRASAKGQACTLEFPGICNHDNETTVLAHLSSDVAGKATKSDDHFSVFSCSACHEALDQHRVSKIAAVYCLRALQRTQKIWFDNGLLKIANDKDEPVKRKTTKITPPPRKMYE